MKLALSILFFLLLSEQVCAQFPDITPQLQDASSSLQKGNSLLQEANNCTDLKQAQKLARKGSRQLKKVHKITLKLAEEIDETGCELIVDNIWEVQGLAYDGWKYGHTAYKGYRLYKNNPQKKIRRKMKDAFDFSTEADTYLREAIQLSKDYRLSPC